MANPTTNFGWVMPTATNLVTDLPADFDVFGQAVDTDFVDLKGGTTGQVLSKTSGTDLAYTWIDPAASPLTTKGDLYGYSTLAARIPIGTNDQVLTADSAEATGLKWAAVGGGGKVLQVVQGTTSTAQAIASVTLTDTNLTATITPSLATSKVLVVLAQFFSVTRDANGSATGDVRLYRATTELFKSEPYVGATAFGGSTRINWTLSFSYLDSPASTSALIYKTQAAVADTTSNASITAQQNGNSSAIILLEIGA